MSRNDIRNRERLAPRALRIRNRCLSNLAEQHALPVPSDKDVDAFDDTVGLGDSWHRWEEKHTPPKGGAVVRANHVPKRTERAGIRVLAGAALLAAFGAGVVGFKFYDHWRVQQVAVEAAARAGWVAVDDSTIASLRGKLLRLGASEVSLRVALTTADVGALILGSLQPRPRLPLDSLKVRIDSLIWIQGRVRGASHVELAGRMRAVRPGRAELRVVRLVVDGVETPASRATRIAIGWSGGADDRLQFAVPAFVGELRLDNRVVQLTTRGPRAPAGREVARARSP